MKNKIGFINKGYNVSSFKALGVLKKKLNTKKVGHMGTLDPLATGCLPFASDGLTPLIPYVPKLPKIYVVEIYFGVSSPSLDAEFVDLENLDYKNIDLNLDRVDEFLLSLQPAYDQMPPDFSAKKIDGKRAFDLARKGQSVALKSKNVEFFSYKILDFKNPILKMEIACGEGFYVRSLVRDLAKFLNLEAFMFSLERKSVGPFNINGTKQDEIKFLNLIDVFKDHEIINIDSEQYEKLKVGIAPEFDSPKQFVFVYFDDTLVYYKVNFQGGFKQRFLIN